MPFYQFGERIFGVAQNNIHFFTRGNEQQNIEQDHISADYNLELDVVSSFYYSSLTPHLIYSCRRVIKVIYFYSSCFVHTKMKHASASPGDFTFSSTPAAHDTQFQNVISKQLLRWILS